MKSQGKSQSLLEMYNSIIEEIEFYVLQVLPEIRELQKTEKVNLLNTDKECIFDWDCELMEFMNMGISSLQDVEETPEFTAYTFYDDEINLRFRFRIWTHWSGMSPKEIARDVVLGR